MKKIKLKKAIKRGEQEIKEVTIHEATAGALRGCSLSDYFNSETTVLAKVLSRTTEPPILESELLALDLATFSKLVGASMGLLDTSEIDENLDEGKQP